MIKLGLLLLVTSLCADVTYWDEQLVRPYVHNSDLQRRWAMSFLAPYLRELKGNENILDVGCGDGKITADISCFVPNGEVVGIDLSAAMIAWAKRQYHLSEYPNLSFHEGSFHEPGLTRSFDRIVSFCALQHSSDPLKAIASLKSLLNPGGKLLILIPTRNNPAWNQARLNIQKSEKWAPFFKNAALRKILTFNEIKDIFEQLPFKDVKVKSLPTVDPFIDLQEIVTWLRGTFMPVVPEDLLEAFYEEWMAEYLRLDPTAQDGDGTIFAKLGVITIEATQE